MADLMREEEAKAAARESRARLEREVLERAKEPASNGAGPSSFAPLAPDVDASAARADDDDRTTAALWNPEQLEAVMGNIAVRPPPHSVLNPTPTLPARRSSAPRGCQLSNFHSPPPRLPLLSSQEPVEFDGDDGASLPGRAGRFAGAQTPREAGDLILGPPEMPWDDTLGAAARAEEQPPRAAAAAAAADDRLENLFVPAALNCHLRDYQREGVQFLYRLHAARKGGVLADDMGLGKTLQTIAFLTSALRSPAARGADGEPPPPALVVCPTSVIGNWENEMRLWGEELEEGPLLVERVHGPNKREAWARLAYPEPGARRPEVALTSYDTFREGAAAFGALDWTACVFDEAHRLKNANAMIYEAARKLPRERRFGLTGTIMQNTYDELHCLLDWACPGSLGGKKEFNEYYSKKMQQAQRYGVDDVTLGVGRDRARQLSALLRKYVLQRKKTAVLAGQLPQKVDNVVFCDLSPLQLKAYRRLIESPDFQLLVRHEEPCDCGSGEQRSKCCHERPPPGSFAPLFDSFDHEHYGQMRCPYCVGLPCVNILRKVSNHLELLKPDPTDDPRKFARDVEVAKLALGEDAEELGGADRADVNFDRVSSAKHCGKMLALEKLLALWHRQNDKVILFSVSTRLLDILEKFLVRKGYVFSRLDGATQQRHRQAVVDEFNRSESLFVFLVSTRAGGVGLNITSANRVVIFDPAWNPAMDLQAQDRSYRIGQRRDVDVYRFLTSGTLEEIVYQRQVYKQQQSNVAVDAAQERRYFEGVQGDAGHKGELFGFTNMFALAADGVTRMQRLVDRERTSADDFYRVEKARDRPLLVPPKSERTPKALAVRGPEPRKEKSEEKDDQVGEDGEDGPGRGSGSGAGPGDERRSGPGRRGRRRASAGGALDRDRDGVLYEHRHEDIVGRPSRAEDERGRRATRAARDAGEIGAAADAQARARAGIAGYRTGGDAATTATASAAEAAGAAAAKRARRDAPRPRANQHEDGDGAGAGDGAGRGASERLSGLSRAESDADDVVAALAAFRGTTTAEMGRRLLASRAVERAALLREFLLSRGADPGIALFH